MSAPPNLSQRFEAGMSSPRGTQTPAPGIPGVLAFDHYPRLDQLILDGGEPGCIYAYVLPHNVRREVTESMKLGRPDLVWRQHPVGQFYVNGVPMVLLEAGKAIPGVPPTNGRRRLYIDKDADPQVGFQPAAPAAEEHKDGGKEKAAAGKR